MNEPDLFKRATNFFLKLRGYRPIRNDEEDPSLFYPSTLTKLQNVQVSFCTTHKNREAHLKKALPINLRDNRSIPHVDIVVVDFDEDYVIGPWIKEHLLEHIQSGYLKYFRAPLKNWSAPIAKNTAHYLAQGDILANLDCDNYTGYEGGQFVIDQFVQTKEESLLWQFSRWRRDGTFGRIAMSKKSFDRLGGYDENLVEMGFQDNDLMNRAMAMGLKRLQVPHKEYSRAIKHEKYLPEGVTFKKLNQRNAKLSKENVAKGVLQANDGVYGIRTGIQKMDDTGGMQDYLI
ncbi:MAG: glycosyltransferase family 2 protein [Cyclobacteriaceae bacterium]